MYFHDRDLVVYSSSQCSKYYDFPGFRVSFNFIVIGIIIPNLADFLSIYNAANPVPLHMYTYYSLQSSMPFLTLGYHPRQIASPQGTRVYAMIKGTAPASTHANILIQIQCCAPCPRRHHRVYGTPIGTINRPGKCVHTLLSFPRLCGSWISMLQWYNQWRLSGHLLLDRIFSRVSSVMVQGTTWQIHTLKAV